MQGIPSRRLHTDIVQLDLSPVMGIQPVSFPRIDRYISDVVLSRIGPQDFPVFSRFHTGCLSSFYVKVKIADSGKRHKALFIPRVIPRIYTDSFFSFYHKLV